MKLDDKAQTEENVQEVNYDLTKNETTQQKCQNKLSLIQQQQITSPTPSLLNFFIFLALIFSLGLFHYRPQNQRLIPITPQYFQDQIYAGELHYSRIPVEYWQHRILMVKAMGLNALSVYVMWNFHEVEKGVFDYERGNRNLTYFLELCVRHDMKVLFRPGPYVCAEWDLGGFPARLLSIPNLILRSSNHEYISQVGIFFSSLAPIIRPYIRNPLDQSTYNKPIIMLQIQNEYGFYGTDKGYISTLRQMWKQLDIHCEEYYVDWIQNIKSSYWQNANVGINNGYGTNGYHLVSAFNKKGIVFGGQIYSGWYKKWGESSDPVSTLDNFVYMYEELLKNNHSFSVYLVHGGTNFGLTAGANHVYNSQTDYAAVTTSYDYESPITENGNITLKYTKFRELIQKYLSQELPPIPEPIKTMNTENFTLIRSQSLLSSIKSKTQAIKSQKFLPFESPELKMFNQGAVIYTTHLTPGFNYTLSIQAHDLGLVFVNDEFTKVLNRSFSTKETVNINCGGFNSCKMEIFVQAMGHINFGRSMETDIKGLIQVKYLNKESLDQRQRELKNQQSDWLMYKIDLQNEPSIDQLPANKCEKPPCIFETEINLTQTQDTFIDLSTYQKGYVWVNGYNLGRYWNIGPQYRLYCPGVWLRKGINKIIILDILQKDFKQINGKQTPY